MTHDVLGLSRVFKQEAASAESASSSSPFCERGTMGTPQRLESRCIGTLGLTFLSVFGRDVGKGGAAQVWPLKTIVLVFDPAVL